MAFWRVRPFRRFASRAAPALALALPNRHSKPYWCPCPTVAVGWVVPSGGRGVARRSSLSVSGGVPRVVASPAFPFVPSRCWCCRLLVLRRCCVLLAGRAGLRVLCLLCAAGAAPRPRWCRAACAGWRRPRAGCCAASAGACGCLPAVRPRSAPAPSPCWCRWRRWSLGVRSRCVLACRPRAVRGVGGAPCRCRPSVGRRFVLLGVGLLAPALPLRGLKPAQKGSYKINRKEKQT